MDRTTSNSEARKNKAQLAPILLAIAIGAALCFCFHTQLADAVNNILIQHHLPALNINNNNVCPSDVNYADPMTEKPLRGTKNFRCYVRP